MPLPAWSVFDFLSLRLGQMLGQMPADVAKRHVDSRVEC